MSNGESELTFINGHNHIGGLQIAFTTESAELFFDLGLSQTEHAALFNAVVPVGGRDKTLTDYLRSGMAPLVDGLYAREHLLGDLSDVIAPIAGVGQFLSEAPRWPQRGRQRAIFMSHLHSDHAGLLRYLAPDQTVYMSALGATIYQAMVRADPDSATSAQVVGLRNLETVSIGDIELTLIDTDHDTPGAAGFIAQTDDGVIAYTGDWRFHGKSPHRMDAFASECNARGVDMLITEASTAVPPGAARWPWGGGLPAGLLGGTAATEHAMTEDEACLALDREITAADGMIFICFHQQHFERIEAIAASAKTAGRRLVVTARVASLWLAAQEMGLLELDPRLVLVLEDEGGAAPGVASISRQQLLADRDGYIVQLASSTYRELLALGADARDVVIHANGHPLGSQYPGWESLNTWVTQLGIPLVVIDSHGHVEPEDLRSFVAAVNAPVVIPVHSDHPSEAAVDPDSIYLPHRWERLRLSNIKRRSTH